MAIVRIQGESERLSGIYYEVESSSSPIGEGGMGKVYAGRLVDSRSGATRPVAIKFLFNDLPPEAIDRGRREASIRLRNDNLIEMLGFIEVDEVRDGVTVRHYHVVSELLTGVSLESLLNGDVKDRNGNVVGYASELLEMRRKNPERFALTVIRQILSGLLALHDAGYIHRDIDPSNIFVTSDDHIKILDFGISKKLGEVPNDKKNLTIQGSFLGKPEYAAPELVLGDVQYQDVTTDIYAVGILLYECIVEKVPFSGSKFEVLTHQIKSELPLDPVKSFELRHIISKACAKNQTERYCSAAEMRVALDRALNGKASPKAKDAHSDSMQSTSQQSKPEAIEQSADGHLYEATVAPKPTSAPKPAKKTTIKNIEENGSGDSGKSSKSKRNSIIFLSVAAVALIAIISYVIVRKSVSSESNPTPVVIADSLAVSDSGAQDSAALPIAEATLPASEASSEPSSETETTELSKPAEDKTSDKKASDDKPVENKVAGNKESQKAKSDQRLKRYLREASSALRQLCGKVHYSEVESDGIVGKSELFKVKKRREMTYRNAQSILHRARMCTDDGRIVKKIRNIESDMRSIKAYELDGRYGQPTIESEQHLRDLCNRIDILIKDCQ